MKLSEMLTRIEEVWNPRFAENWDNVGLLAGRREKEVQKVLVALDADDTAVAKAVAEQADLLITHHPLIFSGIKRIEDGDFIGKRLIELIRNDISYYAMHTNFDVIQMGQLNAKALSLKNPQVLMETTEEAGEVFGIGKIGEVEAMTLADFSELVKKELQLSSVRVYGDVDRKITKAAISGGSGKGAVKFAIAKGAQVLVTGDIDYHTGIDANAQGLAIIDAGHYGTESVFIEAVSRRLSELFPELSVLSVEKKEPFSVL